MNVKHVDNIIYHAIIKDDPINYKFIDAFYMHRRGESISLAEASTASVEAIVFIHWVKFPCLPCNC
jgi:hypothetical protein